MNHKYTKYINICLKLWKLRAKSPSADFSRNILQLTYTEKSTHGNVMKTLNH